jgi:hypothetical protein
MAAIVKDAVAGDRLKPGGIETKCDRHLDLDGSPEPPARWAVELLEFGRAMR